VNRTAVGNGRGVESELKSFPLELAFPEFHLPKLSRTGLIDRNYITLIVCRLIVVLFSMISACHILTRALCLANASENSGLPADYLRRSWQRWLTCTAIMLEASNVESETLVSSIS